MKNLLAYTLFCLLIGCVEAPKPKITKQEFDQVVTSMDHELNQVRIEINKNLNDRAWSKTEDYELSEKMYYEKEKKLHDLACELNFLSVDFRKFLFEHSEFNRYEDVIEKKKKYAELEEDADVFFLKRKGKPMPCFRTKDYITNLEL